MIPLRSFPTAAALLVIGCGGGAEEPAPPPRSSLCQEIGQTCHEPGHAQGGDLQVCHELGHRGDEAVCAKEHERCMRLCAGAPQDR
jgi:hypothetical protein